MTAAAEAGRIADPMPMILKSGRSFPSFILAALALALILTGCGSKGERQGTNTFYLNSTSEPNSLDPIQISQQASWWVGHQIYNGLVGLDADMNPTPKIARAWEVSPDGLVWTFHLRGDVRFCDDEAFDGGKGRTVTAEDVRYSFERVCAPGRSGGYWVFRDKVAGVNDFYESRSDSAATAAPIEHVAGFTVVDDTTFTITLTEPYPPFLYMLTTPFCYIVPREAVEKYGDDFFRHPVGTGPFRLTEWKQAGQIVLAKNTNYFEKDEKGTQLPYLDSVWMTFIGDPGTEFNEFEQGNLDLLTTIDPLFAARLLNESGTELTQEFADMTLHKQPGMSIEYYGFTLDTTTPAGKSSPFSRNVHLRRAINYAIDREKIVHFVLNGLAAPAVHGPIPPSTPGFSGVEGYSFDPDRARAELDSAGHPNGKGLDEIVLQVSNNARTASVAEAVQEDLKKIGLNVSIKQVEHSSHLKMADDGTIAFWRTSWLADYPHAENFMANFYSPFKKPAGPNRSRYDNPTVDSLYRAALDPALDSAGQRDVYARAERIVLDDAPWVFLYYSVVRHITQPWIEGYRADPLQLFDLTRVTKKAA